MKPSRRHLLAVLAIVLYAGFCVALAVGIPDPGCPEGQCASTDEAITLVPADALAYAHAEVDPESEQVADAARIAADLPLVSAELSRRLAFLLPAPGGEPADFAAEVAPWFASEAAVAVLPAERGLGEQVVLLEVADRAGAEEFAAGLAAGGEREIELEGATITVDRRGLASAIVDGFLAVGTETGLREIVRVGAGPGDEDSLASDAVVELATEELPGARLADLFLSRDGVTELVDDPAAPLASLAPFVAPSATEGFFGIVSTFDGNLELTALSALDPGAEGATPSFFSAFRAFSPELPARLPADSLAYVGVGDPAATAEALIDQASSDAPDLAAGFADLAEEIGGSQVAPDLARGFGSEAAATLAPPAEATEGAENAAAAATPVLGLSAELSDPDAARDALARLQIPVAEAIGGLGAPNFTEQEVEGVSANVVELSPGLALAYAIAGESFAGASSVEGLAELIASEGGLSASPGYEAATEGLSPTDPLLLGYLDLAGLVALGERFGLGADPVYAELAPEVRRLRGFGLAVSRRGALLRTDARIVLGDEG